MLRVGWLVPVILALALPCLAQDKFEFQYARKLKIPFESERFEQPLAVHADMHTGEIFVCDIRKHQVAIFDGRGLYRFHINGGELFRSPQDVAVDAEGYIFLLARRAGLKTLLHLDFDGRFLGEIKLTGDDPGVVADPVSVALSPDGKRLYVLDRSGPRLLVADREGRIQKIADLSTGLTEEQAMEQLPGHVDVYDETVLVALSSDGTIRLFDLDGNQTGLVGIRGSGPCQTGFPVAAALDKQGRVMILDKQRAWFMLWEPKTNRCLATFSSIGTARGALYQPDDLALDREAMAYISQGFEGRIQAYQGRSPAAGSGPPR